ncbi:MAG: tRNA (adenosine(37)-N6)-threonylcarbamoyltransferase complex transferase subunit TsaD [bacterium TMED198]|nr:MAG: tRNA (adenosine(37)-N6)-threonylcarbamoyltransferase complex transferase subunit TsaD [bacterium TMED198]
MYILAIETSCDETSAAILYNNKLLSNSVYSHLIHKKYGGVFPEKASREHEVNIIDTVNNALDSANVNIKEINAVSVTYGAGLIGSLLVGVNFAKGISISLDIPLIGVNHLEGHIFANFIENSPQIKFPFVSFLVTGGHTQIWIAKSLGDYELVSDTLDDAAGEAFDKGARILGLEYPGGPEIQKFSKNGDKNKYKFPIPYSKKHPLFFSFSGLKTSLLYKVKDMDDNDFNENINNLAASYQEAIVDTLLDKLKRVLKIHSIKKIYIAGGVAANTRFRKKIDTILNEFNNVDIQFPPIKYCTDNAAMIGLISYYQFLDNRISNLDLIPNPNLSLEKSV